MAIHCGCEHDCNHRIFLPTPYVDEYLDEVADAAGRSEVDVVNTAMQCFSVLMSIYVNLGECIVRQEDGTLREQEAFRTLLKDIVVGVRATRILGDTQQ